ncbi:hypothetical protein Q4F19_10585 [Sphingomonas sp. BIUV-7]|uniref:Uncharacterized protein n=1 Tax=Sphingomonas natans TaxID=3063330 RepID=A0ABT8Y917_9SPHN|nr:hypothetical protein [Sphingomonas sp. BIUV-7]MDO6414826.1 hypothetical protein [Sphingomonas sp. BIUV-7]
MRARSLLALAGALIAAGAAQAAPAPEAVKVEPVSLNCDAISYRGTLDPVTVKQLEPIHNLDAVAAVLKKKGYVFDRARGVVTIGLPPEAKANIDSLPPGEPIVLPAKDGGIVCVLVPSADSV